MISRAIVRAFDRVEPEKRRLWAARLLVGTVVGWLASAVILVVLGQSTFFTQLLNAISWFAISYTAVDILCSTDVRTQQEGQPEGQNASEPGPSGEEEPGSEWVRVKVSRS